jgi:4-methylaminobutanoate oxidase (formaldehyde-forming)
MAAHGPEAGRDIVIVGAGILGAALAWQLAQQGQGHRVMVLERSMPMAGATSRAAALVTLLRRDGAKIQMAKETLAAIAHFEQQERGCVGHHPVGSLHVVPPDLLEAFEAQVLACTNAGVNVRWVDHAYAKARAPWLQVPPDSRVLWVQDDCYVDAYQLGMAYLRRAQASGVRLQMQTPVRKICVQGDTITGVETQAGAFIPASSVVVAAGAWSNVLTVPVGVPLPMAAVRSQYWITAPSPNIAADGAIVFLPEIKAYARPEMGGLLFGLREARSVVVDSRELPADLSGFVFDPHDPQGWESLSEGATTLAQYWPGLGEARMAHYVTGPSNYTVDGQLLAGNTSRLPGLWVVSGCNGSGITFSAGLGRLLSEQILGVTPSFVDGAPMAVQRGGDLDPFDPACMAACADARAGKATG